jgi:hypothetical protein
MNREMKRLYKKYEANIDLENQSWDHIHELIKDPDLFTKKKTKKKKKK